MDRSRAAVRTASARPSSEFWYVVVQENYSVGLDNFRRWISCRSSCARVSSLHLHFHGVVENLRKCFMEFTDGLRELEPP